LTKSSITSTTYRNRKKQAILGLFSGTAIVGMTDLIYNSRRKSDLVLLSIRKIEAEERSA